MSYVGASSITAWGWTLTPCTCCAHCIASVSLRALWTAPVVCVFLSPRLISGRHSLLWVPSTSRCCSLFEALSYVGQGMIMGPRTGVSMFLGSVLGWIILGPLAKQKGWAPGKITSYHDGARG